MLGYFWLSDPKTFLRELSAPIYTNFEGERTPKKRIGCFDLFFCGTKFLKSKYGRTICQGSGAL